MENVKKYKLVRDLVKGSGSQIFSVQFTKKNGDKRVMTVQQAALSSRCKGKDASKAALKAVKTRRENNPNLLNVYSMDSMGIRSVNMDTLDWVKIKGKKYLFN